jgi:hypothetical protein
VKERGRTPLKNDESVAPSPIVSAPPSEDPVADELSRKMLSWGGLWFGSSGSRASAEEHHLVRERLLSWLDRCIGRHARAILSNRVEDVSLATSTPLLTAFLGRRAMVELSRRVLSDL